MDENKENVNGEDAVFTEAKPAENPDKKECCSKDDKSCCSKKNQKKSGVMPVFVLGLLSLLLPLWNSVFALLGFVLGIIAVVKGHKARHMEEVPGLATAGWVMGIIGMVVCGITLVYTICTVASFVVPYHHMYYRTFWF